MEHEKYVKIGNIKNIPDNDEEKDYGAILSPKKHACSTSFTKAFAGLCAIIIAVWMTLLCFNYKTPADDVLMSAEAFPSGNLSIVSAYESDATISAGMGPTDTIVTLSIEGDSRLLTYSAGGYSAGIAKIDGQTYAYMSSMDTSFFKISGDIPQNNDLLAMANDMKKWATPVDRRGARYLGKSDDGLDVARFKRGDGSRGFAYIDPQTSSVKRMEVFSSYSGLDKEKHTEHFLMMFEDPIHITLPDEWTYSKVEEVSGEDFSTKLAMFMFMSTAYSSQGLDADTVNEAYQKMNDE